MIGYIRANLLACVLGLIAAITLPLAVYQSVQIHGFLWFDGLEDKAAKYDTAIQKLVEERRARAADREAYKRAQDEARAKNEAEVKRIVTEQDRISDDVEANLNARLERLRRELRGKSAAPGGVAPSPKTGPDGKAPGGADGPPEVCISSEQFLLGAEYEEKLDQWINWYERLSRVSR